MTFDSLPSTIRDELKTVCDAFEAAWKTGAQPEIKEYLARTEPERTILFQILLEVELEQRRQAGDAPEPGEYLDRFDAFTEVIHTLLGEPAAGPGPPPATDPRAEFTPPEHLGTTLPVPPGGRRERPDPTTQTVPAQIGPYRVIRELGRGNFVVYHARDDRDGRDVAIKVTRPDDPTSRLRMMSLAHEAEKIKALEHPRIVKLYEYVPPGGPGIEADGYIVLEYVEGRDGERTLEELFRAGPVPVPRVVRVVALVAETLHHAHTHSSHVVHRDVKPSNILLDVQGEPRVCDFGLAVDEEIQRLRRGEVAGTPPYMAPEQVRGETHRLDSRTDVWALGVILYRGLTGRLPFPGPGHEQIFEEILRRDPRPLRMYEPAIEPELERICLRCLSRPMSERYLTASDLADDLKRVIDAHSPHPVVPDAIVPKGLRPFDIEDARFFPALLPGPKRGDGMPESVRFWKDWAESSGGEKVFSAGVLYGPTGGGKSSFLRAGLLPSLDRGRVRPIYIDASPAATEARLLDELRRTAAALPPDANLPDAVAILRDAAERRSTAKLIIVLDQFEQWLQAHSDFPSTELVRALRQCDGRRVQVLLVVRDDFWMATTRFMQALDVPLMQGRNAAAVELFDARHSRKVLESFGRALGQLPEAGDPVVEEAEHFLEEAVSGLTDAHGRLIPMQLSLFTEVVKHRPWTPQTLRDLEGVDGIGVKFLADCFAKPEYKRYSTPAKQVLGRLLPPPTSVIRGAPCAAGDLRVAAGLGEQPGEFDELVRVLAGELRLVTVAETDGPAPGPDAALPGGHTRYQLAHDSLVRPIRRWLEREQGSTPPGRARLRLALVTASWVQRPDSRQLPSLFEWASIWRHIPPREWLPDQRRLMSATTRHYLTRGVAALAVAAALALGIQSIRERDRARNLLDQAVSADARTLRGLLPGIAAQRGRVRADLEQIERDGSAPVPHRANAAILLHREQPTAERGLALRDRLLDAGPAEVGLIRETLAGDPVTARSDLLLRTLRDNSVADAKRLRAACALEGLSPVGNDVWAVVAGDLVRSLLHGEDRRTHPQWLSMLGPPRAIDDALRNVCADAAYDPITRSTAAEALAWSLSTGHDPAGLAAALATAQPGASLILLRQLELMSDKQGGVIYLESLVKDPGEPRGDPGIDRQAMAAVALAVLGRPETLQTALQHQADPRLRTATIQKIATLKLAPRVLHEQSHWPPLDGAGRQAVLLAWAETIPLQEIPPATSAAVLRNARRSFQDDAEPGVHSAAELLIRRWDPGSPPLLDPGKGKPPKPYAGKARWEIGPNRHTLVYLRGPLVFRMGSPETEDKRLPHETPHERRIERSLLVATTETTVKQYQIFKQDHVPDPRFCEKGGGSDENPVGGISWYEAIRYCNWLSGQAGLEPFFPNEVKPGTALPKGGRDRGGFRLPTEAEWEYICRAQTETCRPFGESEQFIDKYVWTVLNSRALLWPAGRLLPNEFGLFDTLGSQWEWCLDGPGGSSEQLVYPPASTERPAIDAFQPVPVNEHDWRYVRGGSFSRTPPFARSAHRDIFDAPSENAVFGFRVVRTVRPEDEANE